MGDGFRGGRGAVGMRGLVGKLVEKREVYSYVQKWGMVGYRYILSNYTYTHTYLYVDRGWSENATGPLREMGPTLPERCIVGFHGGGEGDGGA